MNLPIGAVYPLQLLISQYGIGITGQTPTVILQRVSDHYYWTGDDFSSLFHAVVLPEVDSAQQPGLYSLDFQQAVDNTQQTYWAYYNNNSPTYPGVSVEELVYTSPVSVVNTVAVASAVAAKLLVNPAIPINSEDLASQNTLLDVHTHVVGIENNGAKEATLVTGLAEVNGKLDTVISILQPTAGSNMITFVLTDQDALPLPGVKMTIKDSLNQITLAVGYTDANGYLTLGLPVGTFSVLFFKEFIQFPPQPYTLVVSADAVVNIACTTFRPTAPTPTACACYCYLTDASGRPVTGAMIRAKLVGNFPYSPGGGLLATKDYVECISDATGYVSLNLLRNAYYELSSPALYYTLTDWKVPDQDSLDLSTALNQTS
jgi:hypothetical protein